MRGNAVVAAVAGGLLAGGVAVAQDQPAFPSSLDREPLLAWLQRETDIAPERVVAVTPQALTSVVSTFPATAVQGPRVVIRAEALSADTYARTGALSWHVSLSADCDGHRVRLGETTGYPQRNLLGERRQLRPAETEWRAPERGTALDNAWRAACDAQFKGPFGGRTLKVAMETPATPSPATAEPPARKAEAPPTRNPEPKIGAAPQKAGGLVAQIGASPSDADARGLLKALGGRLGGRAAWVEKADVGGRTWYRAVVGGFADAADANGFCAGLKAAGRGCFVRVASR
ncbi:SPOR domain-containing protein [Phenylobacterium sp.]|uniref:SPOR domain-containing protein n=1 Tax=Phenylobacterium sp. TaxID=1871053 RepID=UPI0025FEEA64|nr:SPOR domain-containing protein [Phenylobacterium sp.]